MRGESQFSSSCQIPSGKINHFAHLGVRQLLGPFRDHFEDQMRFFEVDLAPRLELSCACAAELSKTEGSTFRIAGDWNLLGGRSDGAGGPDRTTRAYHFGLSLAA